MTLNFIAGEMNFSNGRPAALSILLVFLTLISLAGQQRPSSEQGREAPPRQEQSQSSPGGETNVAAPVDPKTYKIGPEDVLLIRVWREPELSGAVAVRPDGMVTVPLVGDIQVNGLSPEGLGARLKDEFARFVNNPIVQVYVQSVRSKKYYVSGQIARTGEFPLIVPTTVLEALAKAGNFTDFANRKKIVVIRGDKRFIFNYNDVIKGKKTEQNIYLENGDFIIVP